MRLSITKAIKEPAKEHFENLLESGAFPQVGYSVNKSKDGNYTWLSYGMMEYSLTWARYMKLLDKKMKEAELDTELGVFTRKHSVGFLAKVKELIDTITEADVNSHNDRFPTRMD